MNNKNKIENTISDLIVCISEEIKKHIKEDTQERYYDQIEILTKLIESLISIWSEEKNYFSSNE